MSVVSTPGVGEVAHEVVDVALEPAEAMQREHGSGDDGDAERGFHLGTRIAIGRGSRQTRTPIETRISRYQRGFADFHARMRGSHGTLMLASQA